MITVTLNRTEFEYDIHSLIKAFFPKEDVELYYTKEAHADEKNVACTNHSVEQEEAGSSHFSIDYADDRISIAWVTRQMVRCGAPLRWIFPIVQRQRMH